MKFDLNVFLVTSNVCLDPGLVVMKISNIVDIDIFCGGVTTVAVAPLGRAQNLSSGGATSC